VLPIELMQKRNHVAIVVRSIDEVPRSTHVGLAGRAGQMLKPFGATGDFISGLRVSGLLDNVLNGRRLSILDGCLGGPGRG
jgi:hypothetical protein